MSAMPDLGPAAQCLAGLLSNTTDAQLSAPTPCREYSVGDLIDHLNGLSLAFTAAAGKDRAATAGGPSGDADRLPGDWRTRIPRQLTELAEAWRDPAAWEGMTQAGGFELPGAVAGRVAMNELVVHGWDLARATGQPYSCDAASMTTALEFAAEVAAEPAPAGMFDPPVKVSADAEPLDRLIGLTGRDPAWRG
ncbi:TIGR03086 family protein [Saccharopolyspora subtropica]|uniref:TIGR03086 family metal-binding protein n=1 Tax=Saccharopolyspora thermophila TaxID=89367 RepID=A0A917NBK4_9PSEU|nr:TIGR03086 family metal-binding protein [Saccharopolyspora subtropica]GGI85886.1 TIGR03086 family protein [Saccharopolyspora subtropica]